MRGIVMEVQILIARVGDPIEVADDAVGKSMPPRTEQKWADHDERDISEDREAEGDRHMIADAELATDFDFAERPGHEGPDGAQGDDLPQAALFEGRQSETVFYVWRCNADLPDVPGRTDRRAIEDQRRSERGEDRRRHTEEADIKGSDPEIEQVAADKRAAAHAIFSFEAQHRHRYGLPIQSALRIFEMWAGACVPPTVTDLAALSRKRPGSSFRSVRPFAGEAPPAS